MRIWLSLSLTLALAACGSDNKTSDSDGSTSAATEAETDTPTTDAAESSGSTGGESKIVVDDTQRVCEGNPGGLLPGDLHTPPLSAPGLVVTPLGGGKITISETEYVENCGYEFTAVPELTAPNTLSITYQAMGEIADCECNFTIDSTLSGLSPGTWTIESGELTAMVDVT